MCLAAILPQIRKDSFPLLISIKVVFEVSHFYPRDALPAR